MDGRRLVVATDLSENAEPAAKAAVELGSALGLDVEVLHVLDLNRRKTTEKMEVFHDKKLRAKAEAQVSQWFEDASGEAAQAVVLKIGDPAEEIRKVAGLENVALLAIAMSGRGAWSRLIFGSTAMKLAGRPKGPTAVIHPDYHRFQKGMTIAVGTDFSKASDLALKEAAQMARATDSALRIVHVNVLPSLTVIHEGDLPPGAKTTEVVDWAQESMDELRTRNEELLDGLDVETQVVADHPVAGLRKFVEEQGVDWLVLGDRRPEQRKGTSTVKGKWVQRMNCSTMIIPTIDQI